MNKVVIRIHLSEGRIGIDCTNTPMTGSLPLPDNVTVKFEDFDWTTDEHGFSQGTKHYEPEDDDRYGQRWTWKPGEVIK